MRQTNFLTAALLTLVWSWSANATLITNGGFETGDLTGWSCTGADRCEVITTYPHSGTYNMWGWDNSGFATLAQTIATSVGEMYDLSFWSHAHELSAGNILRYSIGGATPVLVSTTTSYIETMASFTASAATTTIELLFETDGGTGQWRIDDVSVTGAAVPEPTTLALMGLGMAGIGYSRKRKTA